MGSEIKLNIVVKEENDKVLLSTTMIFSVNAVNSTGFELTDKLVSISR